MSYFVHVRWQDVACDPDEKLEFLDECSAREEAVASAREMLAEAIRSAVDNIPDSLDVTDEEDHEIAVVSLRELLPSSFRTGR